MYERTDEAILAALAGLSIYIANLDWSIILSWSIIMFIDVINGSFFALKDGTLKSNTMREGLYRKAMEVFLLSCLVVANFAVERATSVNVPILQFFFLAFMFKDMVSIRETAINSGIKVPSLVTNWIFDMNNKVNKYKGGEDSENKSDGDTHK